MTPSSGRGCPYCRDQERELTRCGDRDGFLERNSAWEGERIPGHPTPTQFQILPKGRVWLNVIKPQLASCHLSKTFVGSSAGHKQWAAFCHLKFLGLSAIAFPSLCSKCVFQPGCWPFYLNIPLLIPPQGLCSWTPFLECDLSHPPSLGSRIILCLAPAASGFLFSIPFIMIFADMTGIAV